jgi:hypothetical protein
LTVLPLLNPVPEPLTMYPFPLDITEPASRTHEFPAALNE